MSRLSRSSQRGQAIVLVALIIVVLFGFLGLAIDGGRGYVDRRQMQASVDAGALAAAYTYVNTTNFAQAEQAGSALYATNERLPSPTCTGYGTLSVACSFGDPTGQTLSITAVDRGIAGVSFTLQGSHAIPVTLMQVLGSGSSMGISAIATAVARLPSANSAAIQTLSPDGCSGGGFSFRITGTGAANVVGDIWSNGSITSNGSATAYVAGDAVDICPPIPPPINGFTVTGQQTNGWTLQDPGFPLPSLNLNPQTWGPSDYNVLRSPGTYASDPKISGSAYCYFLDGGVYTWAQGLTINGGFLSNELRPPDEPSLTATTAMLVGSVTSIPVTALTAAVAGGSAVIINGQAFGVAAAGAVTGATAIPVNATSIGTPIVSGSTVVTMTRAASQFWDTNGVGCSGSFTLSTAGAGGNPAVTPGTYGVEVTAVRWAPQPPSPSCSGPASATCFMRESAPSACKLVTVPAGRVVNVSVSNVPGAMEYHVYVSSSCSGPFRYVGTPITNAVTENNKTGLGTVSQTFNGNSWPPSSGVAPPDPEGPPPAGSGLPNSDPGPNTVPATADRANENQCVNSAGTRVTCPVKLTAGYITPGAVEFYLPGPSAALGLAGGASAYLFSGQQYRRILVYEPGRLQSSTPNTSSNTVAGGSGTSLLGIFYMPAADITITGSSKYTSTISGGVIAWTATINGNGTVSIVGDPSLRTWPGWVALTQ
jgi:hypothetical protein